MVDLFEAMRKLESVEEVSFLYPNPDAKLYSLMFFICPQMKGDGFKLNEHRTGLTAIYGEEFSKSAVERIGRVRAFMSEVKKMELDVEFRIRVILASADPLILFPFPTPRPKDDFKVEGMDLRSNYGAVNSSLDKFVEFCHSKPWKGKGVPQKIVEEEKDRLRTFMPRGTPRNVSDDFLDRTLAGFALDGYIIKTGFFGENPIILGVETRGVSILQNCSFPREDKLPVILLK
jgi:hypothetical protein